MEVTAHELTRQEKIQALAETIADLFIDLVSDDEYTAFIGAELPQAEPTESIARGRTQKPELMNAADITAIALKRGTAADIDRAVQIFNTVCSTPPYNKNRRDVMYFALGTVYAAGRIESPVIRKQKENEIKAIAERLIDLTNEPAAEIE